MDVSAKVEVTELLAPRYETADGLRPLNPIGTDVPRRYQIALATVQQHYLPSDSTLLAFVVNYTVDGRDHATIRHRLKDIAIGDTGVVYGHLATGGRGVGYLVDYYGPTPPFPNGPSVAPQRTLRVAGGCAGSRILHWPRGHATATPTLFGGSVLDLQTTPYVKLY